MTREPANRPPAAGAAKVVIAMTVAGLLLGAAVVLAVARPDVLKAAWTTLKSPGSAGAAASLPQPASSPPTTSAPLAVVAEPPVSVAATKEELEAALTDWIDAFGGHPDDPQLPRGMVGSSDQALLDRSAAEVADLLQEAREFVQAPGAPPRLAFALGRAALTHGYDAEGLKLLQLAADRGSAAAWAYLGYDADAEGEAARAVECLRKAIESGFKSREAQRLLVALTAPDSPEDPAAQSVAASMTASPAGPAEPFDPNHFCRPEIIAALSQGDLAALTKNRLAVLIYLGAVNEALMSETMLFFVDNPQAFCRELDPTYETQVAIQIASSPEVLKQSTEAGLNVLLQGMKGFAEARRETGNQLSLDTMVHEMGGFLGPTTAATAPWKNLQLQGAQDGRRLVLMYNDNPQDFRRIYATIKRFAAAK